MRRLLRAALAALLMLPLALSAVLLTAAPAQAATLNRVTDFGNNPTGLNMYLYVPDNVAPQPALLVLVHYCGGSAGGVFNGIGHDYVTAADRYGYVIVVPEATREGHCFDVSTKPALTRNGGGDSTGIMSMVSWARQRYAVDADRIVVSGFSSGAMMTNVLAAEYPDVFSAASAFSGVAAGCFATDNGSLWNSTCAGGNLIKTPQQWGDQVHAMYPGYTGSYPRMQLWHGTTDDILRYPNFGEEIKEWTNLHGLNQTPSSTENLAGGWVRTRYGGTGNQAPVEGMSIAGYGHSLPLTGMTANAITFLGLDAGGSSSPTSGPLRGTASGRCVDVPNQSTTNGAQVQLYDCWTGANQQWTYSAAGELSVYTGTSRKCLDASGGGTANGTAAIIWSCHGGTNQKWDLRSDGSIVNRQSGLCLDVAGAATANGSKVQLWSCHGGTNQRWTLG
ncbi:MULTISPECIES: extracellular catalytic domain type 1 short-chain-length polyhydroxyalkanoate depolymerase [Glycomyces]|uniref:PHB depolymerase family esterase n=2 Tax=Glycomyces TaxID=58113 RepID=A0A9X3PEZ7_9ACTN|nr:PHB depolymerase family esterase [Glycomyces lechevalierae]MDA1384055.1 PHB depolymerase family esterase [Glycomyces lechevalierae]MDR7340950.1 poly(hydroxyalkanoate) depolymerase family esterase [Glycomyces lechevalierae]